MYYLDSQLTVTHRESSLIRPGVEANSDKEEPDLGARAGSTCTQLVASHSAPLLTEKPKGSVEREIVTMLFESMLGTIVKSWTVIENRVAAEAAPLEPLQGPASSDMTMGTKRKKSINRSAIKGKSRMKIDSEVLQVSPTVTAVDPMQMTWWNGPDEKVHIVFRNGNTYEGNVSMKCMHGTGKFEWTTGTAYLGEFNYNEMRGKGHIEWRNQTWYEGDFAGNLRHGYGIFVNSRTKDSYIGTWYCGLKDGTGIIQYSGAGNYDGNWVKNLRHGFGAREYCAMSGYKGGWENCTREGQGIMIWPNHDFYCGGWKDGLMSGQGFYVWDIYTNGTMSAASQNSYNGYWENGMRHGHGTMRLGFGNGCHYKGQFNKNKKHGCGKFVTGDGMILQGKHLFIDDNLAPAEADASSAFSDDLPNTEPPSFEMCCNIDFWYHIERAMRGIDKQEEIHAGILSAYDAANRDPKVNSPRPQRPEAVNADDELSGNQIRMAWEEKAMQKAIKCYEVSLKRIYYKYATLCNSTEIAFTPLLIRLYLWQFYFDCKVHQKGLTLIEIDKMMDRNPAFLTKKSHNPFEEIYYWQFLHSLISVASRLHAKKYLPTVPDTILAHAFRTFMTDDVLPNTEQTGGKETRVCRDYIPLKAVYKLYRNIGEPHTIRDFLKEVRYPSHWRHAIQPLLCETPEEEIVRGRNVFVIGGQMSFVTEKELFEKEMALKPNEYKLKLFNFGNVSNKTIIHLFAQIFPQIVEKGQIMDLDVKLTFLEFYEVFLMTAQESINVKEEEAKWREKFSMEDTDPKTKTSKKHLHQP